jgi:hypothetical protein
MTINTFNKQRLLITLLALVCLIFASSLFSKCENEKIQLANVNALNKENTFYKLKNGQLVTSVEVLSYDKTQLKNSILLKDKRIKELIDKFNKVKSVTKYITITKFDTIELRYKDTVPCVFNKKDSVLKQWYHISYESNQRGIKITELSIPDSVMVVTGFKRKWFLGKQTQTADITHANPFIQTEQIQHIEVVNPKKWYDTNLFKIGIGFIGGVLITR